MSETTFTFRVDEELKSAFTVAAKAHDRTGAQLLRAYMRDYLRAQEEAASYDAWFRRKVEAGIAAGRAGRVIPSDEVEAYFAERRAVSQRRASEE